MDQAFFLRAKRLLDMRAPARLDHATFIAAVAARQAATPCARAAGRAAAPRLSAPADDDALVAILLAEPGWAAARRCGCFNRAVATRPVNTPSTRLTGIFTSPL